MIDRLLYKFNASTLCIGMLLLLVIVAAVPVPSLVSFKSLEKRLFDCRDDISVLENRSTVIAENKKMALAEWRITAGILERRFGGLDSPLILRNIVLDCSVSSGLKPTLCFYKEEKRLISSEGLADYGARDICTTTVEMCGTGGICEFLVFLTVVEDLNIGIRLRDCSITKSDEFSSDCSFSMTMDGFYVCGGESGIATPSGERK